MTRRDTIRREIGRVLRADDLVEQYTGKQRPTVERAARIALGHKLAALLVELAEASKEEPFGADEPVEPLAAATESAAAEREAVVRWLRADLDGASDAKWAILTGAADAIERGDHRRAP